MSHVRSVRLLTAAVVALLLASLLAVAAPQASADHHHERPFRLTLLHFNDGESDLLPNDDGFGGIDRFVKLIRQEHRSAARWGADIIVSSGDNFLAGPEFAASLEKGPPFFDSIALSQVATDAYVIGNHDFDFGPDVLADFIGGVEWRRRDPVFLSANLDVSAEPRLAALEASGRIAASTVVETDGRKVGIVGATTPDLPFISSPRGVVVDPDVVTAVQAEIDSLEAAGANIIVFVSHLQGVDLDLELLPQLSGVDIAVAGGGDELLANDDDLLVPGDEGEVFGTYPLYSENADGVQVPVVTTSGGYKYLGKLIARFDRAGNLVSLGQNSGPLRVAPIGEPDQVGRNLGITRRVVEPVAESVAELDETVIANSAVDLNGVRGDIRTMETNQGNLIADSQLWLASELAGDFGVAPPDVALANGGGIRNDSIIEAGQITELDTFDMLPFGNFVTVVPDVPREQFKEILENAASQIEGVDGRFAQVAGFSWEISLAGTPQELDEDANVVTAGSRVQSVVLDDGTVIVENGAVVAGDAINIATVDFLARGGDQYPYRGLPITLLGVTYQAALSDYIIGPLGGAITAADYPEGGEGRTTIN
ncbi:MAG: bifunctional metallophosphatase/5'-nucleotidase [Acidimicrobiales bacterium]|nr:bifunctional metallophosphatase/5'-nucleotidase [Acidimicrobiales bacterium]